MTEAQQEQSYRRPGSAPIDAFCEAIREGLYGVADYLVPPQPARDHFRESRIEMLKGFRAIIDHRIDRLSRREGQGARVTVD